MDKQKIMFVRTGEAEHYSIVVKSRPHIGFSMVPSASASR